jgi:gliding motility-associated-like protein
MCSADSITLDFYIADDNYVPAIDVDGVLTTFSQPAVASATTFTTFAHFTQTFYLTAGMHYVNVRTNNYNEVGAIPNPTGLCIYGTVASATATNSLVSESIASCASYTCAHTCSNSISLVDSLHPCNGDVITLPASVTGTDSVMSYLWSPATGLSSTTVLAPSLTAAASSYYNLTLRSLIPHNLVANGEFSAGNTGFSSTYTYLVTCCSTPPNYTVAADPFVFYAGWSSIGDHTTGTGNMLIVDGSTTPGMTFWCETVSVTPGTTYLFSLWTASLELPLPNNRVLINGVPIGTFVPPVTLGVWTQFQFTWNSGAATSATICMDDLNLSGGGNDFAIDDISFREVCFATDSVYVNVTVPDTIFTRNDTALCISGAPISLYSTPGYASYLWSTGSTATNIVASASGTYWVRNINGCALKVDTFNVTYAPFPIVNLGIDTAFCIGNTLVLSSTQPPGYNYLWSDGSSGTSLTVTSTGTYWLQVDNGYCYSADTIRVTISPYPVVDLGPDTFNCTGTPIVLQSSVPYTSPAYLWSEGSSTPSITASLPGVYSLTVTVAGCAGMDTVNVAIIHDTFTLYNPDTAICRAAGNYVQIRLTANPLATFQWLPTAGIATPNIATPRIAPDTSDMYYVYIKIAGCPDLVDSLYIDVQPFPEVDINGFKQVCEFDTLHLHASVTPKWYKYYSFNWSPGTLVDDSTASSVLFKGIDSAKLTLTVTTPAGCSGIDSTLLVVYPGNFANLDTSYHLCPHQEVQLSPTGGVSYRWSPSLFLDDSLSAAPWVRAIVSQAYTVIAKSQHGCTDTLSTHVIIHPAGHIFLGDSVTIFPGEAYQIKSQTNCSYFSWFPPAGLDNPNVSDPVATPVISTRYIVKARTEWGCEAADSINIYYDISSLIAVPNVFSPSGSGVNSKLYLLRRGEATLNYFRIFNRWGNLVFETTDINEGWDGTYKGKPQPLGVFVYEIEAATNTGGTFRKHGNVTLLQ